MKSDFKRIWDFVGRRDFAQEKLFYFFLITSFYSLFFSWLHHLAYRILAAQLGTDLNPVSESPNYWTSREVP